MKYKLLVLTTTFPRRKDDTTPAFVYELCRELRSENIDIVVLAPHHWQAKQQENMEGLEVYRFPYFYPKKYQRLCYDGGILSNMKRSLLARLQAPLLFLSETYNAFKICRKEKVGVIHSHWLIPSGLVGALCSKFMGTRHVLTLHSEQAVIDKLPFRKKITTFILKNSDHITTVSKHIKEGLLASLSPNMKDEVQSKISVVPMGVHTYLLQNQTDAGTLKVRYGIAGKFILLFMGRLVEKKGLTFLIEAMPEIVRQFKDVVLVVCGDGPLRNELEQLADRLMLQNYIKFIGYVTGEKKLDYLALTDIIIVPSIVTESGDTEGLPVVIQEGLAAGKPIIACDVGGINDIVKNAWNGFLVRQKDPNQIAAKVSELIIEKDLRIKFSKNAIKAGDEHNWAVIGKKYFDILKDTNLKNPPEDNV